MNSRFWIQGVATCLLAGANSVFSATYYVDDNSNAGDVYTPTATGNDSNNGTSPTSPKLTLSGLFAATNLVPGDVVFIDTGSYSPATIPNTVTGAPGNRIVFQGSTNITNYVSGGTVFTGGPTTTLLDVRGRHLRIVDVRTVGGQIGLAVNGGTFCEFERIFSSGAQINAGAVFSGDSNVFRRCVFQKSTLDGVAFGGTTATKGNSIEHSVGWSPQSAAFHFPGESFTNMQGCIVAGLYCFFEVNDRTERSVLWGTAGLSSTYETMSDVLRAKPNWARNTVADPKFFNPAALDFHLLSVTGFRSNGVWATSTEHSPAIDLGLLGDLAYTNELPPNGGRVNAGLYGGTAEASQSRTNAWLLALSFNDGGNLIQTGRLEWVASTNLAAAQVNVQFSTNNGGAWSNIATVAATNESYLWVPTASRPAVLWRVVNATNSAIASTNAKAFSVRATTNAAFNFYVNDASTNNDVYCNALGDNANSGTFSNAPKRTLQALLAAYSLRAGDAVYVDTGDYTTNSTAVISAFDSGNAASPVRIVGSPRGSVLSRGNSSIDTMEINFGVHLEISDLQLTGGRYGLNAAGASNVVFRNVRFQGNQWGVGLTAGPKNLRFERCLAISNDVGAIFADGPTARDNQWDNGLMWGNPTAILAPTNHNLSVSNSILGNSTTLFGSRVPLGDYNLVWNAQPGAGFSTFAELANASPSQGWERSLYSDPQFANAGGDDFHLKSVAGRYNPATSNFVVDAVHSPGIDLGNPASLAYTNEPPTNGNRLNVGLYGGTSQASKSRTNAWLQTLSFMDGGTLDAQIGTTFRWTGGNIPPGGTVTIWLSRDSGASWEKLATNLVATTNGSYFYNNTSTNDSSALNARWRVTLDASVVESRTPVDFSYKNGPYIFYVNDANTNKDVYCTAPGNATNLGVSAGSPIDSLAALVNNRQLGPGDRVYVDTGVYYFPTAPVVLTSLDSGVVTNPVVIQGSTNRLAGGSQFGLAGGPTPLVFDFQSGASNVVLRDILLVNVARGVSIANSRDIKLEQVEVRGATDKAFDLQANARSIELLRCVAHGGTTGLALQQATNVVVRHCLFWQNAVNAVYVGTQVGLQLEHNVLAATGLNAELFSIAGPAGISSDYNGVHAGPNARVGANRTSGVRADNLAAWQALSGGLDLRSIPGDPLLANPGPEGAFPYDYHLKTQHTLGRFLPNGDRTSDSVSSPLLDAGNPASLAYTNEVTPNGGRVNIGRFGGTAEASLAVPSPWLRTVSFGDAGGVVNGVVPLRWTAGGGFSNETVKVEVSVDGGKTWGTTVATNVPATNGVANWTVASLPDTPAALWRVSCNERADVSAQSPVFFAIRNSPLNLYVASADTNGTVYTTSPGLPDNWRATSNAPLNSVVTLFDRFDLEPGDNVWVDTGVYSESAPVWIGPKNSGTTGNPVRVTGNTTAPFQGTVLRRASRTIGANVIQLAGAGGVQFRSLMVSNAFVGIHAENSQLVSLDRVRVGYCLTNALFAGANTRMDVTASILEQSLFAGLQAATGSVVKLFNSFARDNVGANVFLQGGNVEVKNSILEAAGAGRFNYFRAGSGTLASDYNNVRVSEGANVAGIAGEPAYRFLIDWQIRTGFANDLRSFGYDPRFHDAGNLDFHLKSPYGRYDPILAGYVYTDTNLSVLIDLGDPAFSFANETTNNGGRINVGLYGNTAEASVSSGQGSLVPLTMSDGGTIRGLAKLYWSFNGIASNALVTVQFSGDGGTTWTNIKVGAYADEGTLGVNWDTTNFTSTAQGVWRVMTTNVPPIIGQTETPFALKNDPLAYYVNDSSTNGDVYCSAIGRATNTGLSADAPMNSLEQLLGRYKVEHGDTVYVDTGIYRRSTPLVIAIPSEGATNRLVFRGSTNEAAGGTVFTNSSGAVLEIQNTRLVELRDFTLQGGEQGLRLTQSSSNAFWRLRSVGARGQGFSLGVRSDQNQFIQCAALLFSQTGFHVTSPQSPLEGSPTTNFWSGGVLAAIPADSNGVATATSVLMGANSGRIFVSNSVFVANGPAHTTYATAAGIIRGDYNCYHLPFTNAFAALSLGAPPFGVQVARLGNLGEWSQWNQCDSNSLAADPLFGNLAAGDLHPRSQGGRYHPATTNFVEDAETSPLIDAADPALAWSLEPPPNGRRANIGWYGNDPFASRSPTNGNYVLLSLNQGGVVRGTHTLRWLTRGEATNVGRNVNVQLSTNSGTSFQTIGSAVSTQGFFTWNSTTAPSLPTARWRVRDQGEATWINETERDFVIHNSNLTYYVNDAATNGGVFTTAPGAAGNSGLQPGSPLPSLRDVLARYDLEPGDQVLIDAGQYAQGEPIAMGFEDGGTLAEPVRIQGVTNSPGTVLLGAGVRLHNTKGVSLRNLQFSSQGVGPEVATVLASEDVALEQVDIVGGLRRGVGIISSSNVLMRNFTVAGMGTTGILNNASFNTRLEFGTIWSNGVAQIAVQNQLEGGGTLVPAHEASFATISNCILGVFGLRNPVYLIRGNLFADYNDLYLANGGLAALAFSANFGREYDSVQSWRQATSNDLRSLSHHPRFADTGTGDYHLRSSAGRYDPATQAYVMVDPPGDNSPGIDAGDPAIVCTEPTPNNGSRVNLGRFGNTSQASKTPTNPTLTLISFNDGGRAAGTNVPVTWNARGAATNGSVTISYSANAGASWTVLTSGVAAAAGQWIWNSTTSAESVQAMLKIEGSVGGSAQSEKLFAVRNAPYQFYVNDGATNNDVYCTMPGDNGNSGLTNSQPMADLNALLAKYDLESGDIVYIDTGTYRGVDPWRITQADSAGDRNLPPVVFQGSTNSLWGGTVLDRQFNAVGIQADYAVGVRLRNIAISNTVGNAVWLNDCYDFESEWIAVGAANVGFRLVLGSHLRIAHCAAVRSLQGVVVDGAPIGTNNLPPVIEHNVFWEMEGTPIQISGKAATVRNNILSILPGNYIYELGFTSELTADYNSIWMQPGGRVFRRQLPSDESPVPIIYETVGTWTAASGQDAHSYDGDPLLANPTMLDFHPKSRTSRYVPGTGWTNDPVSSPLIDAGDPDSAAWTNEPGANGGRVNMGLYGATPWASMSSTNSALYLLTLNRGGVATGQVALNWQAAGRATGHTVRLEVTIDDGATWFRVATNVAAARGGVQWNSLSLPSSPLARWRITDEQEAGIGATSELLFVLHNQPISYYVNDEFADTNDVYCSAPGNSTNSGVSPDSPKRWISEIVDAYNLEPGDVVYVDTGRYQTPATTVIGDLDSGGISQDPSQQVTFLGSTNVLAGGSLYLIADPLAAGFQLDGAYGLRFKHLGIQGASNGIASAESYFISGEWLTIRGCGNGAQFQNSSNIVFSHTALVGNQRAGVYFEGFNRDSMNMESCLLWSNRFGVYLQQGYFRVTNSIFGMMEGGAFGYYLQADAPQSGLQSDYNCLYVGRPDADVGGLQFGSFSTARTTVYASVSAWVQGYGQDRYSLAQDPLLADPGSGDYHLKSVAGRYKPGSGWVTDTNASPLIDAGLPESTNWIAEPPPNGRRVNIGLFGGTPEASKSTASGWIFLICLNDGGEASGDVELCWDVGGAATNYTLCIEFSRDNGVIWDEVLVCGYPAIQRSWTWNSRPYGSTAHGRWRAYCVEDPSINATSEKPFRLRNPPYPGAPSSIHYYVNDVSTNGDVYCTAPGDELNDGLTPGTPKDSLQGILDAWELAPEDVVYVDAGVYPAGSPPIRINQFDSGYDDLYVTIQGSTNPAAPTVFQAPGGFSAPQAFLLEYAVNVRLKNFTIRNAKIGVESFQTIGCELDGVRIEQNFTAGLQLTKSENFRLVRSILWDNKNFEGGVGVILSEGSLVVENGVVWGSPTAVFIDKGNLTATNSVFQAFGPSGRIYSYSKSAFANQFRGDHNSYYRINGALICAQELLAGGSEFYNYMPTWSAATLSDWHSLTMDPLFADPGGGDFHPRSSEGRFVPATATWTNDPLVLSPLIDAGPADWDYGNEPEPNGGFVNIGAYGNTAEASMTQTNPPWLRAISYNEPGLLAGDALLVWTHGGMSADVPVRLDYSTDYTVSWTPIATNVAAGDREFLWDTRALPLSRALYWRVMSMANTNVYDISDFPVSVAPPNVTYYVNDSITNGDVWCKGPGLPCDGGANPTNPAFPAESLTCLLESYPVKAGDRIFVDTGTYAASDAARNLVEARHTGVEGEPLRIYGSTNRLAGGTLVVGNGTANGMDLRNVRYVEVSDFRFTQAREGIALQNSSFITLRGLESFNNRSNGIAAAESSQVEVRNSRLWKNALHGYYSIGSKGEEGLGNCTLWGNTAGAMWMDRFIRVTDSILCATNAAPLYRETGSGGRMIGDYNLYSMVAGGPIGTNEIEKTSYANLRNWQKKGRDLYSLVTDPLLVNPAAGDFHLQSRAGYRSNNNWAVSANTSWAIDAGNPATAWTNEPPTNGSRVNLGAYGGTTEASRSDSSVPELFAVSFRDGGVAPNGQPLYWLYRGIQPTNTVKIEYSPDDGATWVLVASGLRADSAPYYWFTAVDPSPVARWRVVLMANTNVVGATPTNFIHRPVPITYYVNDASTNCDIYCTAVGSATNRGYFPGSPLDSIQAVLTKYQLLAEDGSDEIRVDTGNYVISDSITINTLNGGNATYRTRIRGSTNQTCGGSWLQPAPGMVKPAFAILGNHFELMNLRLTGFTNGVMIDQAAGSVLSNLDVQASTGPGIEIVKAQNVQLLRVVVREGLNVGLSAAQSQPVRVEHCVIWSNRAPAISMFLADLMVSNSVLEASGVGNYCYFSPTSIVLRADYNNVFIRNGAQIASIQGLQYDRLPQWVRGLAQDFHSLSTDPLFHDPANGDFHLRSRTGRYQPGTGWVQDLPPPPSVLGAVRNGNPCPGLEPGPAGYANYSPLIDMGGPRAAWSNELPPNGGRLNIGLYGHTRQASQSNTNRWLLAVTAMSGGITAGRVNLVWGYGGGISSNEIARLEYSFDNGGSWVRIAESAVGAGEYLWDSDLKQAGIDIWPSSPAARWRIFLLGDTNVWDMTDTYFGLRNSPFKYYLNDASTNHDMYVTAVGDDCNLGFYPAAPKLTLVNLLENVDFDPTDELYIDTGTYYLSDTNTPIRWEASDGGATNRPVIVRGSTHSNGTIFIATNRFVAAGFFFMDSSFVDLRDLRFAGESVEFKGSGLEVRNLWLTNGSLRLVSDGALFSQIRVDRGDVTLSGQGNRLERLLQRWGGTAIVGTNVTMINSAVYVTNLMATGVVVDAVSATISNATVVATRGTAIGKRGSGTLRMAHNILVAGGTEESSVIAWESGGLRSDWNNLLARGAAWIGNRDGKWEKLAYWQAASGQDFNSVSFEPLFQSETAGDFHLKSVTGRWSPIFGFWDQDSVHSPVIDLGDPWVGTKAEPLPNGYRLNLGAYGGTAEASWSRTNFWLTALTQNDGGVLKGTNVVLRWASGNEGNRTVALQYFVGGQWTNIATGLSADAGAYVWNTTNFPDGFNVRWRVVGEDDTNVWDQTDSDFSLRNQVQNFYVNDASRSGDIYCSTNGSAAFDGLTPATPKLSLQAILDAYDLEGGDTVWMDTGTYAATSDVRIIWSRGGSTNADVVIQGNTNGPHTVLTRSGPTNYPAVAIDVKASRLQLNNLAIQDIDRGIRLDSNRNVSVQGTVMSRVSTGVGVEHAHNAQVRNSAFSQAGIGVSLFNTRTSVLENLTFALPTIAGIQLSGSVADTLQNNIFIPAEGAYAYSVGTATSLLTSAFMDYNLYDFGNSNTAFHADAPAVTNLRRWQVGNVEGTPPRYPGMNKDFRSEVTRANLADVAAGDFHPLSEYGRWVATNSWVADATTSWAVDHGNPNQDFSREPMDNGGRRNIGMYGNTHQASKGSTNVYLDARSIDQPGIFIDPNDKSWPMVWSAHLVDGAQRVWVEFSADSGLTWAPLTNVLATTEYFIFVAGPEHQTVSGRWRVVGDPNSDLVDINCCDFRVKWFDLGFLAPGPKPVNGLMRMEWVGGVGGLRYRFEYSDDFGQTWKAWEEKYNGPALINRTDFVIPSGESKNSYTFEDRTSYLRRTRWYRIREFK